LLLFCRIRSSTAETAFHDLVIFQVVQRTKLVDQTQEKLLELLDDMTTGTEEETKNFMAVCVETINKYPMDDQVRLQAKPCRPEKCDKFSISQAFIMSQLCIQNQSKKTDVETLLKLQAKGTDPVHLPLLHLDVS